MHGTPEVMARRSTTIPFSIDWLPDGRLVIVSGIVALVTPGGSVRQVADGVAFPNGMAVTPDNSTLILAESYGKRLTAVDIAADGGLANRRRWAPTCTTGSRTASAWMRRVPCGTRTRPTSAACACAKGGEVLQTIELDRGVASRARSGARRRVASG